MRTTPERLLLRLEWQVIRRLDGRIQGSYRTAYRGAGIDFSGLRPYAEGDDARHMDWNVTARLDEPHLRVFTEDRELVAWLVCDRSASMTVGVPGRGKDEVLAEVAMTLGRLFARGGNRVGAVLYDAGRPRTIPPGTGRRHVLRIGAELNRPASHARGRPTDLAQMLESVARVARRRSLIVVISDIIGDGAWERPLLRLAQRHEVAVIRIRDVADDELPEAGVVVIEDAETGEQLVVDSADPLLRGRLREEVAGRDARIAAGTRAAGVALHDIGTADDLPSALVQVVTSTNRRQR